MTQLAHRLTTTHKPRLRLIAAPMSDNERRDTPTIEAPPPSAPDGERITQPPVDTSATTGMTKHGTMLPAAATETPSYFESAARDFAASLVEMRQTRAEISAGFRAQGEKIDAGNRENAQNYAMLRQEFVNFRTLFESKDRDQDSKIDAVVADVAELRRQVAEIKRSPLGHVYDKAMNGINNALTNIQLQLDAFSAKTAADARELAGKTVLIVENEVILASTIGRMLRSRGATAIAAHSWAEIKDLDLSAVDCVLLDLLLGADDGLEIAAWLTAEHGISKSRIILMTGQVGLTNRSGLALLGKPFSSPDVVEAIVASLSS